MATCGSERPGWPDQRCILPPEHQDDHADGYGALAHTWENKADEVVYLNVSGVPTGRQARNQRLLEMAQGAKKATHARPPTRPRHSPHQNSTIAWEDYQERLPRRRREVLEIFLRNVGIWINGIDLHTKEIGGSQGVRRARELRADFDANPHLGWRVEERRVKDSDWDYRLVRRIPEG